MPTSSELRRFLALLCGVALGGLDLTHADATLGEWGRPPGTRAGGCCCYASLCAVQVRVLAIFS